MRIDIWSDVVCPWCYLGHRRFAAALDQLGADGFDVRWHAFELDPHAPAEPTELRPVLERRYGPQALEAAWERLGTAGSAEGIEYRFDLTKRLNTFDAHRLLLWAATVERGRQHALVERTFRAYFSEGADLSDRSTLAGLAADVGLDRADASEALERGAMAEEVRADEAAARDLGITGVPSFVVAEQLLIPGAQETETFVRLLGRALERST